MNLLTTRNQYTNLTNCSGFSGKYMKYFRKYPLSIHLFPEIQWTFGEIAISGKKDLVHLVQVLYEFLH